VINAASVKVGKKIEVSVQFDTVSVEIVCASGYEAQVFYDDISERLLRGEKICLTLGGKD
jgi:hypothetical protein